MPVTLFYLVVWVPVVLLASIATFSVLSGVNGLGWRGLPDWVAWMLYLLPGFCTGVAAYYFIGCQVLRSQRPGDRPPRRTLRVGLLATAGLALAAWLVTGWSTRGFGLVAPFGIWALTGTVGGVVGDTVAWHQAGEMRSK